MSSKKSLKNHSKISKKKEVSDSSDNENYAEQKKLDNVAKTFHDRIKLLLMDNDFVSKIADIMTNILMPIMNDYQMKPSEAHTVSLITQLFNINNAKNVGSRKKNTNKYYKILDAKKKYIDELIESNKLTGDYVLNIKTMNPIKSKANLNCISLKKKINGSNYILKIYTSHAEDPNIDIDDPEFETWKDFYAEDWIIVNEKEIREKNKKSNINTRKFSNFVEKSQKKSDSDDSDDIEEYIEDSENENKPSTSKVRSNVKSKSKSKKNESGSDSDTNFSKTINNVKDNEYYVNDDDDDDED